MLDLRGWFPGLGDHSVAIESGLRMRLLQIKYSDFGTSGYTGTNLTVAKSV